MRYILQHKNDVKNIIETDIQNVKNDLEFVNNNLNSIL